MQILTRLRDVLVSHPRIQKGFSHLQGFSNPLFKPAHTLLPFQRKTHAFLPSTASLFSPRFRVQPPAVFLPLPAGDHSLGD
ncbi:hypothetical protein L2E82_01659 [Cichorium intybus]|uniref:Uncharacterized protein n=1 Tax=Cichorium intybus TaxID=13427 RepID=A0ACB9GZG9_CICIN|nr:hypothetical protein L2E82_01659 [Cichorium intybus]